MTARPGLIEIARHPRRHLVFEDDFEHGHNGWQGLIASGENFYPTLHGASQNGRQSLCIDTRGGVANVTAYATKRAQAFIGKYHLMFRWAWSAKADAGGPEGNGFERGLFALDWQQGATNRKWFEVRYDHYDEGGSAVDPIWALSDGSANAYNPITDLDGYEIGYNQAYKYDWQELEISFDADGPRSKWDKLRLNGVEYDISSYPCGIAQAEVADFDNGSNLLVGCKNRTTNSNADPFVLLDYVRVEWEDL